MNNATLSQFQTGNILGATGLSRGALAALFRNNGLFGRDSDLAAAEQATLQSRLPPIAGLRSAAILPKQTPRLGAVSALADALVARDASAIRERRAAAQAQGLSEAAIVEVVTVVDNVRVVFGFAAKQEKSTSPAGFAELGQAA